MMQPNDSNKSVPVIDASTIDYVEAQVIATNTANATPSARKRAEYGIVEYNNRVYFDNDNEKNNDKKKKAKNFYDDEEKKKKSKSGMFRVLHNNKIGKGKKADPDSSLPAISSREGDGEGHCEKYWFTYTMIVMTIISITLIGYGFGSGLFLPPYGGGAENNSNNDPNDPSSLSAPSSEIVNIEDRYDYKYDIVTLLGLPSVMERTSPQAKAVDWLVFRDVPLFDATSGVDDDATLDSRQVALEQRYALVVWYYAQGGPTLWTTVNRDPTSGWIEHGSGVHECDWDGVLCDYDRDDNRSRSLEDNGNDVDLGNGEKGNGVVVELNQRGGTSGIVVTGTSLSTELGLLSHLRKLDMYDQRLKGSIPKEWSQWTNLEYLNVGRNELQTSIPDWISTSWSNLEYLELSDNMCGGEIIPSKLSTMSNLQTVLLQQNRELTGRFDQAFLDSLTPIGSSIRILDVSDTLLSGTIPSSSIPLPSIRAFHIWNTPRFKGTIPTEIGLWSNLEILNIDENLNLDGTIPTELGLLTNLKKLDIERTQNLLGTLPTELGYLSNTLTEMSFHLSNRAGSLPVEYSKLSKLTSLDLRANPNLTGTLPSEFGQLTDLNYLDLQGTDMQGDVPQEVCDIGDFEWFMANCGTKSKVDIMTCDCCSMSCE